MAKPSTIKQNATNAIPLTATAVAAPAGASTLQRVIHCIEPYTNVRPVKPAYHVGALCQDLDYLGADLNVEFRLRKRQQFWQGEIEGKWSVRYLSDYTDLKRQVNQ